MDRITSPFASGCMQWSSSALVNLISIDQLLVLDNIISYNVFHIIEHRENIDVPLQIDAFLCKIKQDDILAALMQLLPWVCLCVASYPGHVFGGKSGLVSTVCACANDSGNFPRTSPKIKAKSTTGNFTGCLYWATAIMAFLCNILYATFSIWHTFRNKPAITFCIIQHKCSIPSDANVYKDELLTLLFVYIIIPSAVFAELLVSVVAVKFNFHDLRSLRDGQHPSWKQFLRRSIHVLALWNILIAIQLLTMIAIPNCVLLFLHPQVTILCVIMVPASLTLIVAYLLYQCQQPRKRKVCWNAKKCGHIFMQLIVVVAILGLTIALVTLYEVILLVQVQVGTGVKGLLLSLLPSFPLSALGWYLKKRSQKKAESFVNNETPPLKADEQLSMHMFENSRPLPV